MRRTVLLIAAAVFTAGLIACSEDTTTSAGTSAPGTSAAAGGTVAVTLEEWAVAADPSSVAAGSVTFDVTNEGPDDVHEFVIIQTDLSPTELPTAADGSVDEAGGEMTVVDEIEDIAVGDTQSLTVDLEAGAYVLLCNIYDDTEQEAHYQEGMRAPFTVT